VDKLTQIRLKIAMKRRVKERKQVGYKIWREAVLRRDGYRCQICWAGKRAILNAHHLAAYLSNPELRTEISNGITLCKACHEEFHRRYGQGGNTKDQFVDFQNKKKKRKFDE